jgi:hypothetical protein
LNAPIGVRTAPTMTISSFMGGPFGDRCERLGD